jgi:diguanylate cyclase (GGDEF)-like protein/PAS domain S-box-containing protein
MSNFLHLIISPPESSLLYAGNYEPVLVGFSIGVAIFAAYAALLVSQHILLTTNDSARKVWIAAGGLCLGVGIWAMHFVGMLAFNLPCSSSYDGTLTLLSTLPAILACTLAIKLISRREHTFTRLCLGGLLLGAGIGAMHYSGMAAMQLNGFIRYDVKLFFLSILVAIVLSTLALWIKFRLQSWQSRWHSGGMIISAVVMGLAVSGAHYTAMASAYFFRDSDANPARSGLNSTFLALIVLAATSLIVIVTIIATYVRKNNLFFLVRPYRLLGLLIIGWVGIAWLCSDYYYGHVGRDLYQRESRLAARQAEEIANNIDRNVELLKGISLMVSRDEDVRRILRRFKTSESPSLLAYEVRKQRWTHDKQLGKLDDSLDIAATNLGADLIYIINAAGDCVAANNAGKPGSSVGTNFADRAYFDQIQVGLRGHQYAVGRTTNIPGLYYAYPIFEAGHFLGAAIVKRDVSKFSIWTSQANAFISDANGVIILAADKRLELRIMPTRLVAALSAKEVLFQYQRNVLRPLEITSWGDHRFPAAVRIGDDELPSVLASSSLPEDSITVHVPRPLGELARLGSERYWLFILLAATGSMLIVSASASMLYLRESRKVEADLRVAATAFESQQGMFITDANNVILRINHAFTEITGYSPVEAVGNTPHMLSSGHHDAAFYEAMWESIRRTGYWQGEIWNRRKNGEIYPEWLSISVVRNNTGAISHFVAAMSDITRRKAAEEEIQHLAFYDPLTQLPNRRLLMDRLQQALAVSARSKHEGALIFIDLDNFKDLNDTLGHDKGDLLLQQVAERFISCVRDGDTVARLGGDEFVVMLEDLSEIHEDAASQARCVGEKILAALNQPYMLAEREYHSTSSIGLTLFCGHHESVETLLKHADLAMYQAKAAGRNSLCFFDPGMQAVVMARAALEADLRLGLVNNQFMLYYQAQVACDGLPTGAEVLLRWLHPERGMVSPVEFIPAAEESGLILPLGHWVLETACAQLAAWAGNAAMAHLSLAVNISARQFRHPSFVDQVLIVLDGTGANPGNLKLELTESMLLDDVEDIIAKMTALKARGVIFSLDDFGTGYSSLSYLKRLPLDQLKIDQSFVRDVLTDPNDAAIARTIVALGQSLGLEVIAEGVETSLQRDFLEAAGCRAYQGYLFSKPVTLEAFNALVNNSSGGNLEY